MGKEFKWLNKLTHLTSEKLNFSEKYAFET